jgi:carboxypeptidase PM20D1
MAQHRLLKKLLFIALISLTSLLAVLLYKAYIVNQPCQHKIAKSSEIKRLKLADSQIQRLQEALRFRTVSFGKRAQNTTAIADYGKFIRHEFNQLESYPFVKLTPVNNYSLLYEVTGSDPSLKPYLLTAHFDVVPAEAQADKWTHDPFDASIHDNFIYARGTMDNKAQMLGQLEALKSFLSQHGQPKRTIYLAFGHDEEISGEEGAKKITDSLRNTTRLEYVLDEGTYNFLRTLKHLKI